MILTVNQEKKIKEYLNSLDEVLKEINGLEIEAEQNLKEQLEKINNDDKLDDDDKYEISDIYIDQFEEEKEKLQNKRDDYTEFIHDEIQNIELEYEIELERSINEYEELVREEQEAMDAMYDFNDENEFDDDNDNDDNYDDDDGEFDDDNDRLSMYHDYLRQFGEEMPSSTIWQYCSKYDK